MSGRPIVSIVVPTLNSARYLREVLDGVVAQTYGRWELVVVDGGSTDATREIAAGYPRTRVLRQRGVGIADAWNEGIEAARGELIGFLDSDDVWEPRKLALQVAALEADAGVECVISFGRFVLEPGLPPPPGFKPQLLESSHPMPLPTALVARRSVFDRIGVFDPRWLVGSDVDWFARLRDAGVRLEVVPEVLLSKRMHDANTSTRAGTVVNRELLEVLRESVRRKRRVS